MVAGEILENTSSNAAEPEISVKSGETLIENKKFTLKSIPAPPSPM